MRTPRLIAPLIVLALMTNPGSASSPSKTELVLTDFTPATTDLGWYVVNDNVMGGRSQGGFGIDPPELVFSGITNTNGGGFSSIRTRPLELDLSGYEGLRLRVAGDGRQYTWRLATDASLRGRPIGYWARFDTRDGEWTTVDIPFSRFTPRFRGTTLEGPALDLRGITGLGLMIYDGNDGPFRVRLDSVHAYRAEPPATDHEN